LKDFEPEKDPYWAYFDKTLGKFGLLSFAYRDSKFFALPVVCRVVIRKTL